MNALIDILENLGYTMVRGNSTYLQCRAVYRDGKDNTSITIYPKKNLFIDWVTNERGSLEKLIGLTLNLQPVEVEKYLKEKNVTYHIQEIESKTKPLITMTPTFSDHILKELLPIHDYWFRKDITLDTIQLFKGGIDPTGRMKGRYVFPIFNEYFQIIGCVGRDVMPKQEKSKYNRPKYKIVGEKSEFKWPLFLSEKYIRELKEVILVESPHCVLKLWESGIKNTLCLFGTDISFSLINALLILDPKNIIISTNNEPNNRDIGKEAAIKIAHKLLKYFDRDQIRIVLPRRKDFGEQTIEENIQWYERLHNKPNITT